MPHFAEDIDELLLAERTEFLDDQCRVDGEYLSQLDDGYLGRTPSTQSAGSIVTA